MKDLSNLVEATRLSKGLNKSQLAREAGVSSRTIDRAESGEKINGVTQQKISTHGKAQKFFKYESGSAAMEYALLAALIAVLIIVPVTPLGKTLIAWFHTVNTTIAAP